MGGGGEVGFVRPRRAGAIVTLLAVAAACGVGDAETLTPRGSTVPVALDPDTATHLAVVFHADHCLTCDLLGATRALRALERQPDGGLNPRLIAITDRVAEDTAMVRRFLRSERITTPFETMSWAEFRAGFGGAQLPAVYIWRSGRILDAFVLDPSTETPEATGEEPSVLDRLRRAVGGATSPRGVPTPSKREGGR